MAHDELNAAKDYLVCEVCKRYFDPLTGKIVDGWAHVKHVTSHGERCENCFYTNPTAMVTRGTK